MPDIPVVRVSDEPDSHDGRQSIWEMLEVTREQDAEERLGVPPGFEISVAPTRRLDQQAKDEIVAICNRAFDEEDFDELFDLVAAAVNPMHVVGRIDGRLVSHAMWSTRQLWLEDGTTLKAAYLDAVATDPEWQDRGLGSAVVARLMEEISGFDIGCLSTSRVSFYTKLGWEAWTGPRGVKTDDGVEATLQETVMIWRTKRTPRLDKKSRLAIERRRGDPW